MVDSTAEINDIDVEENVSIYKYARVEKTLIKKKSSIGDFSIVKDSRLSEYVQIQRHNYIDHTSFDAHSYTGMNTVVIHSNIGKFNSISWNVTIGPGEHDYKRVTSHSFLYNNYNELKDKNKNPVYNRFDKPCSIGNDVWVGANATILRGVRVGDGAVVAANSVVTKDVPPYAIVGGVPAKVIKYRFSDDIIQGLLEVKWWEFPTEIIKSNWDIFAKKMDKEILEELRGIKSML